MSSQKATIQYLIDMAIGSPDPGIINFNALYTVLLAISEKLALEDVEIEIDSTYCPIRTNPTDDSKINVSSEKLVEHQIFDFTSDLAAGRFWQDKLQGTPRSKPTTEGRQSAGTDLELKPSESNKTIGFCAGDEETNKEIERLDSYRTELMNHIDAMNARLEMIENTFGHSIEMEQKVQCIRMLTVNQFQNQLLDLEKGVHDFKEMNELRERDIDACRKKIEQDKLIAEVDDLKRDLDELKNRGAIGDFKEQQLLVTCILEDEDNRDTTLLQEQLIELKTNVCCLTDQIRNLAEAVDNMKRGSSTGKIRIANFDKDIENLKQYLQNSEDELSALKDECTSQKILIEDLTAKLEELARNKIDKNEIDELLSEKADYTMLQRKVSVENVNTNRRKMDQQLDEINNCFVLHNEHIDKQLAAIKLFLGDKSLEDVLSDFRARVDKDLQLVRDGIKMLLEMKPDVDAAAARLQNGLCRPCNQDLKANVTKFDETQVSTSPNVTFETEKSKVERRIGQSLDLGDALHDMAMNFRHSGGMHTIVTNKDRIEKIRHSKYS